MQSDGAPGPQQSRRGEERDSGGEEMRQEREKHPERKREREIEME